MSNFYALTIGPPTEGVNDFLDIAIIPYENAI